MRSRLHLIAAFGMIVITVSLLSVNFFDRRIGPFTALVPSLSSTASSSCGTQSFDLLNEGMQGNIRKIVFHGSKAYVLLSNGYIAVVDSATDTVLNTIHVGGTKIVFSDSRAYVLGNNVVHVIDTATNTVVGNPIPVGKNPIDILLSGSKVFVANYDDNTISVINTGTNSVTKTIPLGGQVYVSQGGGTVKTRHPRSLTIAGTNLYVGNWGEIASPSINVIDTETETLRNPIEAGASTHAIAVSGDRAYALDGKKVYIINTTGNTVVGAPVALPGNIGGEASNIAIVGSKVYILYPTATLAVIDISTNAVKTIERLGTSAGGIAFSDTKVYVVDAGGSDKVSVIDISTDTVKTILLREPDGYSPSTIAVSGDKAYVGNNLGGVITVINTRTDSIPLACPSADTVCENGRIPLGDLRPNTLAVANGKLYVGHLGNNAVSIVNPVSNSLSGTINNVDVHSFLTFGSKLFAIGNPISVIDTLTDSLENIIGFSQVVFEGAVRNTQIKNAIIANGELFAADYLHDHAKSPPDPGSSVYLINPATYAKTGSFRVGNSPSALVLVGNKLYVLNSNDGTVSAVNPQTHSVFKTIRVGPSTSVYRQLIPVETVNGTRLYGASFNMTDANGSVYVINPSDNTVIKKITVGQQPMALTTVGNFVYVANSTANTVSVIDTRTNTVTATLTVGYRPVAFAVNGTKVYVACESTATSAMGGGTVFVIDSATNTLTGNPIYVGFLPSALTAIGNKVYVTVTDLTESYENAIAVIDVRSNTLACNEPVYPSSSSSSLSCPVPGCPGAYPTGVLDARGCPVYNCPTSSSSSSSAPSVFCGNSVLDLGEQCDMGAPCPTGYFCSNLCQCSPLFVSSSSSATSLFCGDGLITGTETCDDRNTAGGDGCSGTCTMERGWICNGSPSVCQTLCGDTIKAGNEECDDGNILDHDGCNHLCKLDTIINSSSAVSSIPIQYSSASSAYAVCGNGRLEVSEDCETGVRACPTGFTCDRSLCRCGTAAPVSSRASSSSVQSAVCGNDLLEIGEQCERSTPCSSGLCTAACICAPFSSSESSSSSAIAVTSAFSCGNQLLEPGEQCEAGSPCSEGFFCNNLCQCSPLPVLSSISSLPAADCGNGSLEAGEQCDKDFPCAAGICDFLCQCSGPSSSGASSLVVIKTNDCGNGVIEEGEQCDDGNSADGDGCSADYCHHEPGYSCYGQPSACLPVCGDGILIAPEECDDGNSADGDGCSSVCEIERPAAPPTCGNGLLDAGEECELGMTCPVGLCDSCHCVSSSSSESLSSSSFSESSSESSSSSSLAPVLSSATSSIPLPMPETPVTPPLSSGGIGIGRFLLLSAIIFALCALVAFLFLHFRKRREEK
ncbi:MAG: DUF4215 domain-containing protein [Candidatus Peribacteraceae bacterium]|nr:DUF4215 domain-containing protein [Candidatus Peribacteraceae bacterium]